MILGQLYYYDKKLDKLPSPITLDNLSKVELFGLDTLKASDFESLSADELVFKIKSLFTFNFGKALQEEYLGFASDFWQFLSSPLNEVDQRLKPSTSFQREVLDWAKDGYSLAQIPELFLSGSLSSDQTDFALYYGLKTLHTLTKNYSSTSSSASQLALAPQPSSKKTSTLSTSPEIIIVSKAYLSPLFLNVNFLHQELLGTLEDTAKQILNTLAKQTKIKFILIDSNSTQLEAILNKKIASDILVSSVNISQLSLGNESFFDRLAKTTLGLKLPSI